MESQKNYCQRTAPIIRVSGVVFRSVKYVGTIVTLRFDAMDSMAGSLRVTMTQEEAVNLGSALLRYGGALNWSLGRAVEQMEIE